MCNIEKAFFNLKRFLKRKEINDHRSEILDQIKMDLLGYGINEGTIQEVINE